MKQVKLKGLQFIHAQASVKTEKPPVLLVHGAYNNGHVWEQTFIPYFTQLGHEVYAVHLKDEKEAYQKRTLFSYTIKTYAQKLAKLVDHIGVKPVVVAHSMGGLVVQKYMSLYENRLQAVCLLAAVAPFGTINTLKMMFANPVMLLRYTMLTLNPAIAQKYPPSHGLLSARSDEATRKSFQSFILRESVFALLGTFMPAIDTEKVKKTPLLVLGAEKDNLILPKDIIETGKIYQTGSKIYPEMGHFMMLEPDWKEVADEIVKSLDLL